MNLEPCILPNMIFLSSQRGCRSNLLRSRWGFRRVWQYRYEEVASHRVPCCRLLLGSKMQFRQLPGERMSPLTNQLGQRVCNGISGQQGVCRLSMDHSQILQWDLGSLENSKLACSSTAGPVMNEPLSARGISAKQPRNVSLPERNDGNR